MINYFKNRFSMINKVIIFYKIDIKKILSCSSASNRNDELRHETKIDHEMKEIRIQIIFCRFCKLRKKLHISNATFQRDHLSCFVRHMSQKKQSIQTRLN